MAKAAKDIHRARSLHGIGGISSSSPCRSLVAFVRRRGLGRRDAIGAVLRNNLFGLEIDPRCTQIAAFNLAFAAWKRTGFHALPQLNLACSGLAIGVTKASG